MIQYIDITKTFRNKIDGEIIPHKREDWPIYCGYKCAAYDLYIKSHCYAYFETSAHLFRDGTKPIDIPIEDFFLPASIVTLSDDDGITYDELDSSAGSFVRAGDALLIHCQQESRYFEREAIKWMIEKGIKLLGSNLLTYDRGFENPTGMFVDLFQADIPIIANITNLDKIPTNKARLVVLPLKIPDVCLAPCRAVVIAETAEET